MNISKLLNPVGEGDGDASIPILVRSSSERTHHNDTAEESSVLASSSKRLMNGKFKSTKKQTDRTMEKPNSRCAVCYPPFKTTTKELAQQQKRFGIYPDEDIQANPQYTPYSSNKKDLFEKTGCEGFEAYHYRFRYQDGKVGDPEKITYLDCNPWTVMWDFNTGLVRMTALFKALEHAKTTPKKAIERNKGLMALCPSVTGGAISAQGYWMPFEAARAMAATFCWKIRFALTPLFGPEFPASCLRPTDEGFGNWEVPAEVVRSCAVHMRQLKYGSDTNEPPSDFMSRVPRSSARKTREATLSETPESTLMEVSPVVKRIKTLATPRRQRDPVFLDEESFSQLKRQLARGEVSKEAVFHAMELLWKSLGLGEIVEYSLLDRHRQI